MAEYKLSYTASEINNRLEKVDEIDTLKKLIGDDTVANQIAEAMVEVYVQDEEPTNAPNESIWVDTSSKGLNNPSNTHVSPNIHVEDIRSTDFSTIDFSKYAVGDVIIITAN